MTGLIRIFAAVLLALSVGQARAEVLVLYDAETAPREGLVSARMMAALLGHFPEVGRRVLPQSELTADLARDAELLVYLRTGYDRVNPVLIDAVVEGRKRTLLLGSDLEWLRTAVDMPGRIGLSFDGRKVGFDSIAFRGKVLPSGDGTLGLVTVADAARVEVLARAHPAQDPDAAAPYLLRAGNRWIVLDMPFWQHSAGDRLLVLAEVLHDVLGIAHEGQGRQATVRIEDVDVDNEPERIWEITQMLSERDIPFTLAVVALKRDPGQPDVPISERPLLLEALRNAAANGATIGVQGYTHQTTDSSGFEHEFLEIDPAIAARETEQRIGLALEALTRERLFPLLWMTPDNAALGAAYEVIARHFTTAMERRMMTDDPDTEMTFPFQIASDLYGMRILPENLGFVELDFGTDGIDEKLAVADLHSVVRDAAVGFEFHSYLDLGLLRQIVDGLAEQGYAFVDIARQPGSVDWQAGHISADPDRVQDRGRGSQWTSVNGDLNAGLAPDAGARAIFASLDRPVSSAPAAIPASDARRVLNPLDDAVYLGAFLSGGTEDRIDTDAIRAFERKTGKPLGWVYFSQNWGDGLLFPREDSDTIRDLGAIPFIRLMPRSDFDNDTESGVAADPSYNLQSIIDGEWDAPLRAWARAAGAYGDPLMLDFAPEMNATWFRWSGAVNGGGQTGGYGDADLADGPERYRDAYRHIIDLFRAEQVRNVTWVFHVFAARPSQQAWNRIPAYYPGDDYIDWLAVSAYGAQDTDELWQSFEDVMEGVYDTLVTMSPGKPIVVAEFGTREDGEINGRKAQWIRDALQSIEFGRFPAVRGLSYWNEAWVSEEGNAVDLRVNSSASALAAYAGEIGKPLYRTELSFSGGKP